MKLRVSWCLAVLALASGCGKEERREAVGLYNVLAENRPAFAVSNELEKDLVGSVRSWCEFITANGAGPGAQLNQNVRVARDLAKSTADVSARVGLVRQAVYNQTIQKEFPQGVRNTLIGQLTRRQRFLQEMRAALEDAAKGFESLKQSRDYKGDTYPNAIDKLSQMLQSYKAPGDAVAEAVGALTSKYSIPDAVAGT